MENVICIYLNRMTFNSIRRSLLVYWNTYGRYKTNEANYLNWNPNYAESFDTLNYECCFIVQQVGELSKEALPEPFPNHFSPIFLFQNYFNLLVHPESQMSKLSWSIFVNISIGFRKYSFVTLPEAKDFCKKVQCNESFCLNVYYYWTICSF